jgi:hypothetical protein
VPPVRTPKADSRYRENNSNVSKPVTPTTPHGAAGKPASQLVKSNGV